MVTIAINKNNKGDYEICVSQFYSKNNARRRDGAFIFDSSKHNVEDLIRNLNHVFTVFDKAKQGSVTLPKA